MRPLALAISLLLAFPANAARPAAKAPSAVVPGLPSIIDGHADFGLHYLRRDWSVDAYDIEHAFPGQAGVMRWKAGGVNGVLATVGTDRPPGSMNHFPRVLASLDWFDSLLARHSQSLVSARSARDFKSAGIAGKIALMAAIEGGDQLDGSLANLHTVYKRGVRSVLIVYDHNNNIGDGAMVMAGSAAYAAKSHGGLSPFGRQLVREMNRLGMIVDLSHAAESTALDAIRISKAPVIFTHSSARALADTPRNVSDKVLRAVQADGGLVMIPLVPYLTTTAHWRWWSDGEATYAKLKALHPGDKAAISRGMAEWDNANPQPKVGIEDVANQIDYVAAIVGKDHVGIGTDFDGMDDFSIADLKDASRLPALLQELKRRGWSYGEIEDLARRNFLRVMTRIQASARR